MAQPPPPNPRLSGPMKGGDWQRGLKLAAELTQIKYKLGQMGLFKTMHALDGATRAIGYEMADRGPA